jgi:hypothetical protein
MATLNRAAPLVPGDEGLAAELRAAHGVWLEETTRFLLPAVQEAPCRERWAALREMASVFVGQHRRERALLENLRPFLSEATAERLDQDGDRIARLQCELDRVGRRRGTPRTVSVISHQLLELLRAWCTEIEEAARDIP